MCYRAFATLNYCLTVTLPLATTVHARSYYLDSVDGNDSQEGTSAKSAWRSLEKANSHKFKSGDRILLKRGGRFGGKLFLTKISGTSRKPIVIAAYSEGERPIIDAAGYAAGVHLANCNFVEVRDLEITADGGAPVDDSDEKSRYGVLVSSYKGGATNGLKLSNLYIHTIYPHEATESEGTNPTTYMGVAIRIAGISKEPSKNIRIENCHVENTGHAVLRAHWTTGLKILDNHMENIGGPAMVPSHCTDLLVRGNTVDHSGAYTDKRMHGRGSGIWPHHCERVLIEKNRFMHARGRYDSCGAHIDIGNRNVVIQYNLSLDNEGGFAEILGENFNCAYRYNISINDGARVKDSQRQSGDGHTILFSGHNGKPERAGPTHCYVYNNTIYVKRNQHCSFSIEDTTNRVLVANNLFFVEGQAVNGTPKWWANYSPGIGKQVAWRNNLYNRRGIFPTDWPFKESKAMIANPKFSNPGGLTAEDYIPANRSVVEDRGIEIPKIPGDKIGLKIGLAVEKDYFGNSIRGLPDLGAVEISSSPSQEQTESFIATGGRNEEGSGAEDRLASLSGKNDFYTIVDSKGRSIEARILHVDSTYVYVQLRDQRTFAVGKKTLRTVTNDLVTEWKKKFADPLTVEQKEYLKKLRAIQTAKP